jgi:hypothetical protein
MVRKCSECGLRFTNSSKLEDDLARDHAHAEPESREDWS